MTTGYRRKTFVLTLLAPLFAGVVAAAPPPVEAFGRKPAMIDVDINPAGTRLAWIEDDGKVSYVIIYDLAAHKNLRRLNVDATTRLRAVRWANDDTVLIDERATHSVEAGGRNADEWQRWAAVDATGGAARLMLMGGGERNWVTGASLVRRQTTRPGKVYMSTLDFLATRFQMETGSRLTGGKKDSGWVSILYEVDLASGNGKALVSGTPFTVDWLADASAEHVLRSDFNPTSGNFEIYVRRGSLWKELYKSKDCGRLSLLGLNALNTAAIVGGQTCGDERSKVWSLPLDGSPMTVLIEDPELDAEHTIFDPFDDRVLGMAMSGSDEPVRWLEPQAERRSSALQRSFGSPNVRMLGRSADYKRVIVLAEKMQQAPVYYLVDFTAKTADILNERYPLLTGVKLGAVRQFKYLARDQYPLFGYLTAPPEASEKNQPVVVLPHGGPEARDDPGFDWMAQFFASRGYIVFQPQFRGSSGLGNGHAIAGRQQWGLRMQDDVTDGVRALIEQGIADPNRICIVGGSYGGYVALAGAAFTPELYACAAGIAGVFDLPAFIGYIKTLEGKESNSVAYWREHIGPAMAPQVIAKSPARNAGAIRAPILLLHGTDDTTVPVAQSRLMARALEGANKGHQLIELPGDDHFLSSSVMRVRALTELERFLAENLAPAQAAAN